MNRLCSCGGELLTLDENKFYFRKCCANCATIYKQHKRRADGAGAKTIYIRDAKLWDDFVDQAKYEEMSTFALIEKAMTNYLRRLTDGK